MASENFTVRLDAEEAEVLQRLALRMDESRARVIKLALQSLAKSQQMNEEISSLRAEMQAQREALEFLREDLMTVQRRALIATLKTLKTPIDARATAEQAEKISASIFGEPKT